jgi:PTH1 family peptidyl-tRNA hydrolase
MSYKIIAGLGNPGTEYENTRHNVGFGVVDKLIQTLNPLACTSKFKADICEAHPESGKVFLFKSKTYMNESGEPLGEFCRYYKIAPEEVLVIYDDLDLPVGKLRFSVGGSSGGHNGVQSIIDHLGVEFSRLRIGIGDNRAAGLPSEKYVLASFPPAEREIIEKAIEATHSISLKILGAGDAPSIQAAIAEYNKNLSE